jgi:hypothetical protein
MKFLETELLESIANSILTHIGYDAGTRKTFWNGIDTTFTAMQKTSDTPMIQLDLDLAALNHTGRLTDGTIPFEFWLAKATRYLRMNPEALQLLQKAADQISLQVGNEVKLEAPAPPPEKVIEKVQLERTIHQDDMVSFLFLENGYHAGNSVVRMKVTRYENDSVKYLADGDPCIYLGTGWLLAQSLVITNHHVICARSNEEVGPTKAEFMLQAAATVAEFDYNSNAQIGVNVPTTELLVSSEQLDYAIFRLPLQQNRQGMRLLPERIQIAPNTSVVVNIIQHPMGYAKKVAIRNNHIYDSPYPKIRYFTDTDAGSSGSPVFNDKWEVVGLHRAHSMIENVDYMGKQTAFINEGVQIEAILNDLKKQNESIWKEVTQNL